MSLHPDTFHFQSTKSNSVVMVSKFAEEQHEFYGAVDNYLLYQPNCTVLEAHLNCILASTKCNCNSAVDLLCSVRLCTISKVQGAVGTDLIFAQMLKCTQWCRLLVGSSHLLATYSPPPISRTSSQLNQHFRWPFLQKSM